jgi:UDPglucose 6-dehydrogenase
VKIGYCGLGKLGFPVALATEAAGHNVFGYDPHVDIKSFLKNKEIPYQEKGVPELLKSRTSLSKDRGSFVVVENPFELVTHSDLIFVPVQTPHDPHYEGTAPPPNEVKDFNYTYLKAAMADLAKAAAWQKKVVTVVIISTVLPGTVEREIKPLLNDYVHLAYNPYFIAMGTTVDDYLNPEFVLLGCDDGPQIVNQVQHFYSTIHDKPVFVTNIETAELIKVAYNTFISMKIVFANTMMEICQKTNADVDDLTEALSLATDRVISPRYLRGGMGDGGGCHPRDNIAMSWLA